MIKRFLLLTLLLCLPLFAMHYNASLLEIQAKLFPKIAMMSEDREKSKKNLTIYIIAKQSDYIQAKKLKELIETNYPHKALKRDILVSIDVFREFKNSPDAIIILDHTPQELQEIALWANEHKVISLAYDPYYLQYGILASLFIGPSTKPYINKEILQKYNFRFNSYLLKLSKFK